MTKAQSDWLKNRFILRFRPGFVLLEGEPIVSSLFKPLI